MRGGEGMEVQITDDVEGPCILSYMYMQTQGSIQISMQIHILLKESAYVVYSDSCRIYHMRQIAA